MNGLLPVSSGPTAAKHLVHVEARDPPQRKHTFTTPSSSPVASIQEVSRFTLLTGDLLECYESQIDSHRCSGGSSYWWIFVRLSSNFPVAVSKVLKGSRQSGRTLNEKGYWTHNIAFALPTAYTDLPSALVAKPLHDRLDGLAWNFSSACPCSS